MLDRASEGSHGHGPIQLLIHSAASLDWTWDTGHHAWIRPGLPELHILAGPIQHYQSAMFDAWGYKVPRDLCEGKVSAVAPLLDIQASQQLLVSSHVRERDKGSLRGILIGGVWNGFFFEHVRGEVVPCRVVVWMVMVCSGTAHTLRWYRESLEFSSLISRGHIQDGFESWLPESVFSAGRP